MNEESELKTLTAEFTNKLADKEKEWRDKEKEYIADLLKQTKELQDTLSLAEGAMLSAFIPFLRVT